MDEHRYRVVVVMPCCGRPVELHIPARLVAREWGLAVEVDDGHAWLACRVHARTCPGEG